MVTMSESKRQVTNGNLRRYRTRQVNKSHAERALT